VQEHIRVEKNHAQDEMRNKEALADNSARPQFFCIRGRLVFGGAGWVYQNEFENRSDMLYELAYTLTKDEFIEFFGKIA